MIARRCCTFWAILALQFLDPMGSSAQTRVMIYVSVSCDLQLCQSQNDELALSSTAVTALSQRFFGGAFKASQPDAWRKSLIDTEGYGWPNSLFVEIDPSEGRGWTEWGDGWRVVLKLFARGQQKPQWSWESKLVETEVEAMAEMVRGIAKMPRPK